MRLKYEFSVRDIMGEYVMVPLREGALEFSGMIGTSETGALLVEALRQDVTRDDLLTRILDAYDVDAQTAQADLDEVLAHLRSLNLLIAD